MLEEGNCYQAVPSCRNLRDERIFGPWAAKTKHVMTWMLPLSQAGKENGQSQATDVVIGKGAGEGAGQLLSMTAVPTNTS